MEFFLILMIVFGFLFSGFWRARDIDWNEYKQEVTQQREATNSALQQENRLLTLPSTNP